LAGTPSSIAAEQGGGPHARSAPSGPERLPLGDWGSAGKRALKDFLANDCLGLGQQVAYSSLLAFFPAVIFLVGLLGLIGPGAYSSVNDLLAPVAPKGVLDAINLAKNASANNATGSAIAFAVGAAGAIWAASGATGSIVKAVNRAYDLVETRPFWKVKLLAFGLVFALSAVLATLFLLIVFGAPMGEAIAEKASLGHAFDLAWSIARWPIGFAALLLFFAIVYYLAPNHSQRSWKWLTPGALVGALLWLGLSALFALYTSFSSSYDRTYGSLAGAIILLLWLYYSSLAVLAGAELNAELDRQADIRAAGGPHAGLVMPSRRR
jgi:membrane protein